MLFVYSTPEAPNRADVLAQLALGVRPNDLDGRLRCIEVGAGEDLPPIVGWWEGLPVALSHHSKAVAAIEAAEGEGPWAQVGTHLSAMFPMLEYEAGGRRRFYEPRTGRVLSSFRVRSAPDPGDEKRASIQRQWAVRLADSNSPHSTTEAR